MAPLRLTITGANGFVGRKVVAAATAEHGDTIELVPFFDPQTGQSPDIANAAAVERTIAAIKPDRVLHLAAIAAPREAQRDSKRAWAVNVDGTLNIARALMAHRPEARLVWSGSSEAYGASFNRSPLPLPETAALEPMSAYGASKAAADVALAQLGRSGDLDTVVLRPFNHTGAGQATDYVVPAFASQIAKIERGEQEPVLKVGNLEALRDFLDVEDVVALYLAAVLAEGPFQGEAFNVSSGRPVSVRSILDKLLSMATSSITVEVDPSRYSPNTVPVATGDASKAFERFRWFPKVPLEKTLADVLSSLRLSR